MKEVILLCNNLTQIAQTSRIRQILENEEKTKKINNFTWYFLANMRRMLICLFHCNQNHNNNSSCIDLSSNHMYNLQVQKKNDMLIKLYLIKKIFKKEIRRNKKKPAYL